MTMTMKHEARPRMRDDAKQMKRKQIEPPEKRRTKMRQKKKAKQGAKAT